MASDPAHPVYGIIGVGAIATAIVDGYFAHGGEAELLLSPRGAATAAALAARHRTARVCASNQAVLDGADIVLLCVRPQDAAPILAALEFRPDHLVISAMAGISIAQLAALVAPARDIARTIPLPSITTKAVATPIYPPTAAARRLFDPLGGVIECRDESVFDAFSATTATIAAYLAYLQTIGDWLTAHDVPAEAANRYVAAMFAGLAGALSSGRNLGELATDHTTPGGTNALFRQHLTEAGVYDTVRAGLASVFDRVSASRLNAPPSP